MVQNDAFNLVMKPEKEKFRTPQSSLPRQILSSTDDIATPGDVSSSVQDIEKYDDNSLSSYFCGVCNQGFATAANYSAHMKTHTGQCYKCNFCGSSFQTKQTLKYHESEHTGVYRFSCDECDRGFNEKRQFVEHMKSHMPLR